MTFTDDEWEFFEEVGRKHPHWTSSQAAMVTVLWYGAHRCWELGVPHSARNVRVHLKSTGLADWDVRYVMRVIRRIRRGGFTVE